MNLSHLIWVTQKSAASVLRDDDTTGTAKSDTRSLKVPASGFHANADGTVTIKDRHGNEVEYAVNAGTGYPYEVAQILATGTTLADSEIVLGWGS